MLGVLQGTVVRLYTRLWTVRDPFLLGKSDDFNEDSAASYQGAAGMDDELDELYVALNLLGRLTVDSLREHRTIKLLQSRIPHVVFFTWIHSADSRTRAEALANVGVLSLADSTDRDPWREFFGDVLGGGLRHEHVTDAIVRDLGDSESVDESLTSVLCFLSVWHKFNISARRSLSSNALLAPYCLAAMRRQLCRGIDEDPKVHVSVASEVFMNLYFGLEVRGRQFYAFIDALCVYITLSIQQEPAGPPTNLTTILTWALRQHRATDDRPKTVALRHASLAAWNAVAEAMAQRSLARRPAWSSVVRLWGTLRARMLPAPTVPRVLAWGSERCAWEACLCSRHKPAHRMRVCKGCGWVAYCGERCQKRCVLSFVVCIWC
ncbi:hypothetical protein PsYK624_095010 [Phanerochaete sordida]|uniref:MYND-type domain-containing protein n=1 Tax=Phanerochaete sordida TaxID=48140 RepID=A0A9P3LGQ7_9APHY|nr:hypothetical protein PsYK624_095010 [Phanerochaete sordida]